MLVAVAVTQELAYLSSVLALKKGKSPEKITELLNEAIELHFAGLKVGLLSLQKICFFLDNINNDNNNVPFLLQSTRPIT